MKTVGIIEQPNGALLVTEGDSNKIKEVDIYEEISKEVFREKFPENEDYFACISTDLVDYLDSGDILLSSEWNGEIYILKGGKSYRPVYKRLGEDDYDIIGYVKE